MKRGSWKAALVPAALVAAAVTAAAPASADPELALRRVLLSSGGVGYFELEATVHHDAELPLAVPFDQVDDVLKSIVVYDSHGSVGEITLPAKAPADAVFRDLPFDAAALASLPDLLDALRGAEVVVTLDAGQLAGRILSVTEETQKSDDTTVTRHRIAVEAAGAVRTAILEDAKNVLLTDPALRRQIDTALASLLVQKDRGRRTVTVHSKGEGDRTVRVAYVVGVPLWKSTYRMTLPEGARDAKADLQGWAVVENQSGVDWNDVDLTLTSGDPVTFRQALYASYYVDRPEIPVEVAGHVLPRLEGGVTAVTEKHMESLATRGRTDGAWAVPGMVMGPAAPAAPPMPAMVTPAETAEAATQVVFHLPAAVTLASGQAGLLPVIARQVPAEQVSLYQPDVQGRNPLTAVELRNDGDTGLPPGAVTTYARTSGGFLTYVGDARLAALPAGEKRLLAFGVDQDVTIDRRESQAQPITVASISGGVLTVTRAERRVTDYTIAGAAHAPRVVILDHPRIPGFDLVEPRRQVEGVSEHDYRIKVEVPAGATVPMKVVLERPVEQNMVIADLAGDALSAFARNSELPSAIRNALAQVAALRTTLADKVAAAKALEAELTRITGDQARIRDDLKAVPAGSALAKRYLDTLAQQEDRLADLGKLITDARAAVRAAEQALAQFIRSLHL